MRNDVSQWDLFQKIGVKVFDVGNFDLKRDIKLEDNRVLIKQYFSERNYKMQLEQLLSTTRFV